MTTHITDNERKLQTQVNLLTTTNEVLAERLAAADDVLAVYAIAVRNLTAERDAQSKAADHWMTEACAEHNNCVRLEAERDALADRVKALETQLDKRRDQIGDLNVAHAKDQRQNFERVKALEAAASRYLWLCTNGLFAQSQGYDTQIGIAGALFVNAINTPDPSAAIDAAIKGATNE
jgi:hypothetical protein